MQRRDNRPLDPRPALAIPNSTRRRKTATRMAAVVLMTAAIAAPRFLQANPQSVETSSASADGPARWLKSVLPSGNTTGYTFTVTSTGSDPAQPDLNIKATPRRATKNGPPTFYTDAYGVIQYTEDSDAPRGRHRRPQPDHAARPMAVVLNSRP